MKKAEFDKLLKKYQPVMKKTGKQLAKATKTAEEDIFKMYKMVQVYAELQVKNIQKEKIYYQIGKYIAGELAKDKINLPELEKYKKRLLEITADGEKIKKSLAGMKKTAAGKEPAKKGKPGRKSIENKSD